MAVEFFRRAEVVLLMSGRGFAVLLREQKSAGRGTGDGTPYAPLVSIAHGPPRMPAANQTAQSGFDQISDPVRGGGTRSTWSETALINRP